MHRTTLIWNTATALLVAVFFMGASVQLQAADRYWVGAAISGSGNNNWSTASNWSTVAPPAYSAALTAPGAADVAIFNNTASTVNITAAVTVGSLTITQNVDVAFVANGTLTVSGVTTLQEGASINVGGTAATHMQLNGTISFVSGTTALNPTQIYSSTTPLKVVSLGSAATLSMGDLRYTYFGDGVNVWITRDTGLLTSPVRFNDDITIDAEFNPGVHDVWLGASAEILRSAYNNQTQHFISFSNDTLGTVGMVIKDIAYWMSDATNYNANAGYFNWEVGVGKIAAVRVDVNYARFDTWSPSATEPFRGVGIRTVNLVHPANRAANRYEFYWVVQPIGLVQDNSPAFPPYVAPTNNICYEVEFHPGYIQGSPQNVTSARYSDNFEDAGQGQGWYTDGSTLTGSNSSGRVFVPQCSAVGFGDITIASGSDPVPVELTAFSARYLDGQVRLNWQTATELNNFGFAIERSQNGEEWEEVGFVAGNGTSYSPKSYSYTDVLQSEYLRVPQLAYRLRQMDRDGTTDFSNIVFVSTGELPENAELYAAYPNPFNPTTTISFAIKQSANVTLKVYNTFGQEVATLLANSAMDAGLHTVPFSGDQLPSGIYMAVLDADGSQQHQKLVLNK